MALIIGISGKKQSGKNTICDNLKKYYHDNIDNWGCKIYSFADALKEKVCIDVLGLDKEQCYGTDEQKNTLTQYKWENLPFEIRQKNHLGIEYASNGEIYNFIMPTGFMTAREIMQVVGTDIFRKYFDDSIWVNATFRNIAKDKCPFVLISDVRFPSEVRGVIDAGGYMIRLSRDIYNDDDHSSEVALDKYDWLIHDSRICMIDNKNMSIDEQAKIAIDFFENVRDF